MTQYVTKLISDSKLASTWVLGEIISQMFILKGNAAFVFRSDSEYVYEYILVLPK